MQIDQIISDFITGADRIGTFFEGLDKFITGSTEVHDIFFGEKAPELSFNTNQIFANMSSANPEGTGLVENVAGEGTAAL